VRSDTGCMAADVERAEAHILDLCNALGRWLDDPGGRKTANGRLCEALDGHTLDMLKHGLGAHPYQFRGSALRR
jgi:hypothetical protein